jgi:putative ABC transport system permease protein
MMQDFRLGFRNLLRRPAFSVSAILTLTLGIGANAAVFTVSNAVLLAPLPYDRPGDVVILNGQTPQFATASVTRYNYEEWRARAKSFSGMAAFRPTNSPDDYVMAGYRAVTPEYLATLGVPLHRGRMLSEWDREGAPLVVVINESMARQYFPDRDPLGQRIQLGTEPSPDFPTMEIVGVVGDVKQSFEAGSKAEMFVPYGQYPDPILAGMYLNTALIVRTTGKAADATGSVRAALREIDAGQPLVNVRTMETAMAGTVAQPRFQMTLLMIFASVAVALAAVGVYGVMAYTVSQRIPEIGVRIAVGASPNQVVTMVVWQGAQLAVMGMVLGLIAAALASGAMQSLLFDVRGLDPLTFAIAPIVLGLAALLASYIPARRAARISPLAALGR